MQNEDVQVGSSKDFHNHRFPQRSLVSITQNNLVGDQQVAEDASERNSTHRRRKFKIIPQEPIGQLRPKSSCAN